VIASLILTAAVVGQFGKDTPRGHLDPIQATVQARRARQYRRDSAVAVRKAKLVQAALEDQVAAEAMRRRIMENQAHMANVQQAINGAVANQVQMQSNAVQAQRNQVLRENAVAIQRAAGIVICSNCGAQGHYACAPVQKSPAVLEYEAMLRSMIP
jgi:hypothetical protein